MHVNYGWISYFLFGWQDNYSNSHIYFPNPNINWIMYFWIIVFEPDVLFCKILAKVHAFYIVKSIFATVIFSWSSSLIPLCLGFQFSMIIRKWYFMKYSWNSNYFFFNRMTQKLGSHNCIFWRKSFNHIIN